MHLLLVFEELSEVSLRQFEIGRGKNLQFRLARKIRQEILSKDDTMSYVLDKCQAYQTWGFEYVYVVNPESRQLFRWIGTALEVSDKLTSIPATRIWEQLDEAMRRRR